MKVFEFQCNPKARKDRFSRIVSSNDLIVAGELLNALPSNEKFLDAIVDTILQEYSNSKNLKQSLKRVNEYLGAEVKKGNVDWLGNFHLAALSVGIKPKGREQFFSLGKCGTIKALISRKGNLIDIDKKVEPNRSFEISSVVSSALFPEDKVILCSRDLFDAFSDENIFSDIAFFKEEKQFKALFQAKEKILSKAPGFLVSALIEEIRIEKVPLPFLFKQKRDTLKQAIPFALLIFLLLLGLLLF
ncbi:MAG: hypothetical protein HYS52_00200 [Candidatus Wildermuthbacteria bacterium]|nr:hypothetical protein [Candidatus Wildermuthbacteria bacterium]